MVKDEKTFTEAVLRFLLLSCRNVLLLRQIKSAEILLNMAPVKKSVKVNYHLFLRKGFSVNSLLKKQNFEAF